jgi:hypothetical protein
MEREGEGVAHDGQFEGRRVHPPRRLGLGSALPGGGVALLVDVLVRIADEACVLCMCMLFGCGQLRVGERGVVELCERVDPAVCETAPWLLRAC